MNPLELEIQCASLGRVSIQPAAGHSLPHATKVSKWKQFSPNSSRLWSSNSDGNARATLTHTIVGHERNLRRFNSNFFGIDIQLGPLRGVDLSCCSFRGASPPQRWQRLISKIWTGCSGCGRGCRPPGQIVLGLGSGRCGSTSLSALLGAIEGSCATHENPPLIYWRPEKAQLDFHMRRFKLLSEFFPLVFDASHWWLRAIDRFFTDFPNGKAIGLHRYSQTCAVLCARKGTGSRVNQSLGRPATVFGARIIGIRPIQPIRCRKLPARIPTQQERN